MFESDQVGDILIVLFEKKIPQNFTCLIMIWSNLDKDVK